MKLVTEGGRVADDLLELVEDVALEGFQSRGCAVEFGGDVEDGLDFGHEEGFGLGELAEFDAGGAFGEDKAAQVGHFHDFVNGGKGAVFLEVFGLWGVLAGVALGDDDDFALVAEGFDELDGAFAADGEGKDGMGEEDGIADREDGELGKAGGLGRFFVLRGVKH